ncbi:MAG: DUF4105 domain-containing protein [Verrucomicrobia bacterium]|nr:DUF4105 domain-containing protein [Verrucomicrobiota bacterium]
MKALRSFLSGGFRLLLGLLNLLLRVLLIGWGVGALWWSSLPWSGLRMLLAVLFLTAGIWMLWRMRPARRGFVSFTIMFAVVVAGWTMIQPTHQRNWATDVAVLPRVEIEGDRVIIHNVRNFDYREGAEPVVRYEDREVLLSHLKSLDLFVSFSGKPGPMAHTFVSFVFDNVPPVCISIEARRRAGDSYRPVASMFKQFELIYIAGDERDIVRVRTNYRKENVCLYHLRVKPENVRALFLNYLERMNRIEREPEFYNLLSNNCTINIHKHLAETRGPAPWDWAMLLNGWTARLAYERGAVDTTRLYEELEKISRINDRALAADRDPDFSERIRDSLPMPAGF